MTNIRKNIQTLRFALGDFKKWCGEKGNEEVGRSGQAWNCPASNYLAHSICKEDSLEEVPIISRAWLVSSGGIYNLPSCDGQAEIEYFCPEIVTKIIELADCIPENTIWSGRSFLRAMIHAGL